MDRYVPCKFKYTLLPKKSQICISVWFFLIVEHLKSLNIKVSQCTMRMASGRRTFRVYANTLWLCVFRLAGAEFRGVSGRGWAAGGQETRRAGLRGASGAHEARGPGFTAPPQQPAAPQGGPAALHDEPADAAEPDAAQGEDDAAAAEGPAGGVLPARPSHWGKTDATFCPPQRPQTCIEPLWSDALSLMSVWCQTLKAKTLSDWLVFWLILILL